jgi:hypothetical protein
MQFYPESGAATGVSICNSRDNAANADFFTHEITMARDGYVYLAPNIIRYHSGRADLQLYVDGVMKNQVLTWTPSWQWESAPIMWAGALSAGKHTISLRSPVANVWGAGCTWGSFDYATWFPEYGTASSTEISASLNIAANANLVAKTITMDAAGPAFISTNMIRHMTGRSDLRLLIDGNYVRHALTYTNTNAWENAEIFWAGTLSAGSHTITVTASTGSVWGAGTTWGSLDVATFKAMDWRAECSAA